MKNSHANLLEASYNISDKDWRIIRSMLRVLLRQSDTVRKSENVANAIQNIARDQDRIVFFKYFIKGQSILNVSMDQYFSVESVKRYLKRGTKDFIAVYNNGALAKLFIE